ncbi:signal peptidase I [Patescibacteria group bacterium]|nr:signal peptidase I [Patescibacteria group bacterium]MBU1499767.1 signal peptidase I [Patescibacteria group bacterium]
MLKKKLKKAISVFQWLLTTVLVLVVLLLIFTAFNPVKSFQIFRVMSGSMEPKIKVGSVVFVQKVKPETLKEGNIITFTSREDPNISITHRLIATEEKEGQTVFKTRGDANNSDDISETLPGQIKGKVVFSLPFLGYLSVWIRKPLGFGLLVILPALLIIISEILNIKKAIEKEVEKKYADAKDAKKKFRSLSLLIFFLLGISLFQIKPTNAYFSDVVVVGSNTFSMGWWADETVPDSEVDLLSDYQNTSNFNVNYTAFDSDSGVKEVQLYYSYNFGDWQLFGTDTIIDNEFQFTSPAGDGLYEFFTIAIDNAGNIEDDWNENGILEEDEFPFGGDTFTTVDTTPPVTMLSPSDLMAVANEQLYNGGFENGNLDGWTGSGNGEHEVVDTDNQTGNYSAIIGFKDIVPSAEPAYDSIKQTVSLPSVITSTFSFWYRLLTESDVSGGFFDAFVTPIGSDPITVAHDGWDDVLLSDENLDWKNVTYQLNDLEGKDIEIEFKVTQPYEGYKTWGYLDDVKVCAATNSATTTTNFSFSSHDGSGVDNSTINYSIDGVSQGKYTLPFTLSEGVHSISYSSTDEVGNSETSKQATISATVAPVDFGVVLNEFLPNPAGSTDIALKPGGEWVKLYNNSTADIDVTGWKLKDASGGNLTISGVVPAGGTLIIYRDGDPDFTINDQTETISLYNDSDLVDSYRYDFATGIAEGKSLKREPDGTGGWKDPEVGPEATPEPTPEPTPELILIPLPEIATELASPSALIIAPEPSPEPTPELTSEPSLPPDLPIQEPIVIEEILNETAE